MAQLNTDLETIKTARDNMKTALEGQGQTVTKDIRTYAQAIANISGGGSSDVKLFDTIEHMQEDENPQDGGLAVVYREELQPVTEESEFDSCVFPNEVVLDEAFTGSISGSFRSTVSGWFDGYVNMSASSFRFDGYGDEMIRVEYTSQDGITYTRTDGGEELQEFGTTIQWDNGMESFNSVIGNFMKIGGNYFEGLYQYGNYLDSNYHNSFININSITIKDEIYLVASTGKFISDLYNIRNTRPYVVLQKSSGTFHNIDFSEMTEAYELSDENNWSGTYRNAPRGVIIAKDLSTNKFTLFYVKHSTDEQHPDIQSIKIGHYSNNTLIEEDKNVSYYGVSTYRDSSYKFYFYKITDITEVVYVDDIYFSYSGNLDFRVWQYYSTTNEINGPQFLGTLKDDFGINYNKYNLISSQLDTTPDYVYEKTFYGKNGVETGTLITNVSNSFADVNAEVFVKIQQQYENMQPRVLTDQDKTIDTNIYFIPVKSDGTPLLNTSNATNMRGMFSDCSSLTTIPQLDTSSVTNMYSMFTNCISLSNESLNNILAMCTNSVVTSNKTLKEVGLTQEQVTICQGLSNYSAFISAGWTTGY